MAKGYVRLENIRCRAQFWRKNAKAEKVKKKGKKEHGVFSLIQDLSNIFPVPVYFRTKLPLSFLILCVLSAVL